jgi:anthranilate phosphoribosyltransferase
VDPVTLRGGDADRNAAVARSVFAGDDGPVRDAVLLNAAAALAALDVTSGSIEDRLREGMRRAAEAVDGGAADEVLRRWVETSRRLAGRAAS